MNDEEENVKNENEKKNKKKEERLKKKDEKRLINELKREEKRIKREQMLREVYQSYGIKDFTESKQNINYINENNLKKDKKDEDEL